MTIAETIATIAARCSAVTFEGGYGVLSEGAGRVTFEPARILEKRTNGLGRCTRLMAQYSDGSRLTYRFAEGRGARIDTQ